MNHSLKKPLTNTRTVRYSVVKCYGCGIITQKQKQEKIIDYENIGSRLQINKPTNHFFVDKKNRKFLINQKVYKCIRIYQCNKGA